MKHLILAACAALLILPGCQGCGGSGGSLGGQEVSVGLPTIGLYNPAARVRGPDFVVQQAPTYYAMPAPMAAPRYVGAPAAPFGAPCVGQ